MKRNLTLVLTVLIAIALGSVQPANAQANTKLSNLVSPTAVNQALLPNNNNGRDIGSAARSWRVMYLDSAIYLKDAIFMHSAGANNAFVGFQAGKSITSGISNAALGYNALTANTTGSQNTALGWSALPVNTSGSNNTALGKAVLYTNTDGNFNSGSGYQALFYNWHGNNNTASGAYSLFQNINGSDNTAMGINSMRFNQTGGLNAAFGENALYSNTTGGYNTASGVNALFNSTSSFANVAIGFQAGYNITDGQYNVYLGANADGSAHLTNTVALGANVKATNSNTIILGTTQNVGIGTTNPSAKLYVTTQDQTTATYSATNAANGNGVIGEANNGTLAYGVWGKSTSGNAVVGNSTSGNGVAGYGDHYGVYGSSSNYAGYFNGNVNVIGTVFSTSDQKLKENIKPVDKILDKVMLLKPSSYNFKKEYSKMNLPQGEQVGFIAQDLEKVFPQLVKTINDQQPGKEEQSEYKGVNYIGLIPLLTKAIQEQQEEISALKQEVKTLAGNTALNDNASASKTINISDGALGQNIPNPFSGNTSIQYNIPAHFKSAQLVIADAKGTVVKQVQLTTAGKGTININAYNLSSGAYTYSLIVDGSTIESKKMIVGK